MYYIDQDNFWRDDLDDREVIVSIRCITYNHENYIRDALEGFVNQKTNFRFEAIIHDDASTDETAAIIREYAEKYPSIIKPIFETENQYSKHDGSLSRIMNAFMRGKYIALCEGDDYWIDSLKLQKQIDFLESHPEYSTCFHLVKELKDGKLISEIFNHLEQRDYTVKDFFKHWTIPTCSSVFKYEVLKSLPTDKRFNTGDSVIFYNCAANGKIFCMSSIMGVYRINDKGWVKSQTFGNEFLKKQASHYEAMAESFRQFEKGLQFVMSKYIVSLILESVKKLDFYDSKFILHFVNKYPFSLTKALIYILIRKVTFMFRKTSNFT